MVFDSLTNSLLPSYVLCHAMLCVLLASGACLLCQSLRRRASVAIESTHGKGKPVAMHGGQSTIAVVEVGDNASTAYVERSTKYLSRHDSRADLNLFKSIPTLLEGRSSRHEQPCGLSWTKATLKHAQKLPHCLAPKLIVRRSTGDLAVQDSSNLQSIARNAGR